MELWQSLPLVSIILPLFSAAVMIVLRGKGARAFCFAVLGGETLLSGFFLIKIRAFGQSYTYPMGHYPAPFGNEIRAGLFEAIALFFFMLILLLSLAGGLHKLEEHVRKERMPLYYAMILLMTASLSAQIFTNDLFTSYVFVEIMTLAAAGLIAAHGKGRAILASARYMVMK
jgi:multicomponent Na+:H+ antiporter subunit D